MFNASGFVHLDCAKAYFETADIGDAIAQFSNELDPNDLKSIQDRLANTPATDS